MPNNKEELQFTSIIPHDKNVYEIGLRRSYFVQNEKGYSIVTFSPKDLYKVRKNTTLLPFVQKMNNLYMRILISFSILQIITTLITTANCVYTKHESYYIMTSVFKPNGLFIDNFK